MGTTTAAGAKTGAGVPLPPISVARFEEALGLVELMVAENQKTFIEHGQRFREQHRETTGRHLNAIEAVQVAAGVLDDRTPEDRAAAFQAHDGLRAYDEPGQQEVLLAAGVATAPALLHATLRVVALIELDDTEFQEARESDRLVPVLDAKVGELRQLGLKEARVRAAAALEHLADEVGVEPGKAWALVASSVWQALTQAMTQLSPGTPSGSSSLTDSPPSTAGDESRSSTAPATATPVA